MDLQKELLKKETLPQTNKIIKWVGKDEHRFKELVNLFYNGDYKTIQNAAWPVSYCIRTYGFLAKPYFKRFIDTLESENPHPAARRNILRLLQYVDTPKRYRGKLMDLCFRFVSDPEEVITVKAFSLAILDKLSNEYPEILPELKTIIEARWEFETPSFKSRARKILRKV
jgi:hypothetical protein